MLTSVGTGAPPDMDDSIIRDFVTQVSQVIVPKKEFAVRAPDVPTTRAPDAGSGGTTTRAPDAGGGGTTTRAPDAGGGGTRAGGDAPAAGGTRAGGDAPAGAPTRTTNADGSPAPTSASGVKNEIKVESKRPKDESTDHSPDGKKKQTDDAEKEKNDWLSKVGGLGGLAMIGLTVGIATAIAAKTGEQYAACVNANISITKVAPTPRVPEWLPEWEWLVNLFPLPTTVDITYTVDTSYTPLAKSDTWDITGTGTAVDKNAVPLEKVLKGKSIRIKCGSEDCSNVKSTQGSAQVNCDFADRLNKAVEDVSTDIGSTLAKFTASAGAAFFQFLPLIILVVALYFGFMLFSK
jgi:hypothetical protein